MSRFAEYYILIMGLLFIVSCNNNTAERVIANKAATSTTTITETKNTVSLISIRNRLFSNPEQQDSFVLVLNGTSILSGDLALEIFDHNHQQIFIDTFPAVDLLGDYEITDSNEKEDTIKARINRFFSNSNFVTPATNIKHFFNPTDSVSSYLLPDDPHSDCDKSMWLDIKSDTASVGFGYAHGYEGFYMIAYSKSKKAVVTYFTSD